MAFEASKRAAAEAAVRFVQAGMVVGLGTGSTSMLMLELLARAVRDGLQIQGVPTSDVIAEQAGRLGIPLHPQYPNFLHVDLTLDGADEVDPEGRLIKGGGAALLREKLVASASSRLIIMVDESKKVPRLGRAIPVEVIPFGWARLQKRVEELGARVQLRTRDGEPVQTDHGNLVFDCDFGPLDDPAGTHEELKKLPGVVETGLFLGLASCLVVGSEDGTAQVQHFYPAPPSYGRA
jgi:ribose 5-phosphate isomerase A